MNRKRVLSFLLSLTLLGTIFSFAPLNAQAYSYDSNMLQNPQPTGNITGWSNSGNVGFNDSSGGEFKGTNNDGFKVWQTFNLTANDRIRANNGELTVSGSGDFWSQPTATMWPYIIARFYDAGGNYVGEAKKDYAGTDNNITLTFSGQRIPANTVSIIFEAYNDDGVWQIHPAMRNFSFSISDTVAPTLISCYPTTAAGIYPSGTTISFCLLFSEPITIVGSASSSTLSINAGGTATYAGQSADKTTLYYNYVIPASGTIADSYQIYPTAINGTTVKDDSGKTCTASGKINNGAIYMDNKPPQVSSLTTSASSGATYTTGETIVFSANFSENIVVSGSPTITLNTGKTAVYKSYTSSDTKQANFEYTVTSGDNTSALAITACNFSGIKDKVGNAASYSATQHNSALNGYNIKVDTAPPTATFNEINSNQFQNKNLSVMAYPTDVLSPIKEVYSAWNTADSQPSFPSVANVAAPDYKVTIPSNSGTYYLFTKIIDVCSNIGFVKSPYIYKFDFDKPQISADITNIEGTQILKDIVINVSDAASGVKSATYKWKNSNASVVLSGNVVTGEKLNKPAVDGVLSLEVTAVDNVDNTETKTFTSLNLDASAPTAEFSPNGNSQFLQSHTVNVSISDSASGVENFYYLWSDTATNPDADSESWILGTQQGFTTPSGKTGTWYLHIKATDKAGNTQIYSSNGFNIDNTVPQISITPNGNEGNVGRAEYLVGITISDSNTPYNNLLKKYVVSSDETCPDSGLLDLTSDTVTISELTANKYLYVQATDAAGNTNTFKSNVFAADKASPTGSLTKVKDVYYVNHKNVDLNLDASDNFSDDLMMQFSVNGTEAQWETFNQSKTILLPDSQQEHIINVRFKDESNNISPWYEVKYCYDITAPEISLEYSTTAITNGSVTVTADANDDKSDVSFETVKEKTFTENGGFSFVAVDEAGNRHTRIAIVTNIDKTPPTVNFVSDMFDGKKHKEVAVTVNANDTNGVQSLLYRFVKDGVNAEYTSFSVADVLKLNNTDGSYQLEIKATDTVGNENVVKSQALLLDNTAPTATIKYTPATRTSQNVVATITTSEACTITNNEGSSSYIFTENGEFTFEFCDEAGNTGSLVASVDYIDRTAPKAEVSIKDENGNMLSASEWTNKTVCAYIVPPANSIIENVEFNDAPVAEADGIEILNDSIFDYYKISKYGVLKFNIKDTQTDVVGNGEIQIRVDKTPPVISKVNYSSTAPTNQNVTATVVAEDALTTVTYSPSNVHTFTENGSFDITVTDLAGNQKIQTVTVSNIDKEVPVGSITYTVDEQLYSTNDYTNKNVVATVTFPNESADVTVNNNGGNTSYEFTSNGEFTFEFTDAAGNSGTAKATVGKIDKIAPTGYVTYSENGWTNKDVVATLHASDDKTGIEYVNTTDENHTFTENGEFEFEISDEAGNIAKIKAIADRIDKTPPTLSYTLTPPADFNTPFSVFAQLTADEPITVLNNGANPTLRFTSNGSFTFKACDRANNVAETTVNVNNISRETTPVRLEYSETDITNENVFVKILPQNINDIIYIKNNSGEHTYKFTENGQFVFEYTNDAGIDATAIADVNNIDKNAPVVEVAYSADSITNSDVTATLTANKEVIYPYGVANGKYVFTENEDVIIPVTDYAGNVSYVELKVDIIDKEAPTITMQKASECISIGTNVDVMSGVTVADNVAINGDIQIVGAVDGNTIGDYNVTYTATDTAGNTTICEKIFTVYDPDAFNVIINDKMPIGGQIVSDTNDVDIKIINSQGKVKIKYLPNKKAIGDFKDDGYVIQSNFTFEESGYYTLLVEDAEYQMKLISLFIK